jgi:tetratricopeptide (TPR) repeat protein
MPTDEAQTIFEHAKQLLVDKKATEAISAFIVAIQLDPNNSAYHAWYAQALNDNKQYADALEEATLAIQFDPQNGKAFRMRGFAYRGLEKYIESIDEFSKAIKIDENDDTAFINRGHSYNDLGKYDLAIQDYTKAIEIDHNSHFSFSSRGNSYCNLEKYDLAIRDFTRAIELDNNDSYSFGRRGKAYYFLKSYELAIQDTTKAIGIDLQDKWAYYFRYLAYYETKDISNYLLDLTRYHALGGEIVPYNTESKLQDVIQLCRAVNTHLKDSMFPKFQQENEILVDSYLVTLVVWDRQEEQNWVNGTSFNNQYGTLGQGYICISDKNVHIVTFGELSRILDKYYNRPRSFLGSLFSNGDKTEISKTDHWWAIPNATITSVQNIDDPLFKRSSIRIRTGEMNWDIFSPSSEDQKEIHLAVNMAKDGKFTDLWAKIPSDADVLPSQTQSEIIVLITKLNELKTIGAISEAEFEEKKKELLSRL